MSKELVVSATRHETRIAILEDDQVVEIYYQREKEYSLAGSIHKGRVTRVLPGMQSAFVDIGLERDAFLYVSDFFEDNEEYDKVVTGVEEKVLKMEKSAPAPVELSGPAELEAGNGETEVSNAAEPLALAAAIDAAVVDAKNAEVRTEPRSEGRADRDGRERGRGRRGRRRRGGRGGQGSGLPESKYYSPRRDERDESDAVAEQPATDEQYAAEDFAVLPGESLAKYSAAEPHEEQAREEEEAEVREELAEPVEKEPEVEPAPARAAVEPPPIPAEALAKPEAAAEVAPEVERHAIFETKATEGLVIESLANEPEEVQDSVTEAIESTVDAAEAGESAEVSGEVAVEVQAEEEAEAEASEAESEAAEIEPVVEEEEGPEPARIPTSLTAALREQGGRFPHRLSRRARRKLRGSHQGEPRHGGAAAAGEEPAAEGNVATTPEVTRGAGEGRRERGRERGRDRGEREQRVERQERSERPGPSITELLREGQEIIVQIAKEPLGQKGARITSHIALPGRFLVYMPTVDHVGVSRKIPSDDERQRLKKILQANRTGMTGGFIVRTAGDGKSEEELRADMHFLYNLWLDIRQKAEKKPAPLLLHHDLDLVQRILRDQLTSSFKTIWVDNEEAYESVLRFVQRFQPALVSRVKLYTRATPIFDEFNITAELEKALRPKVWLKSGGYIVINQTEALVAIDVNTGKYVGKSNRLEDTIVRVNTDAIKEIVRQIRLRDLGGIIVVDFIDMDERKNRQKVMQALEEAMRVDRAPYKILAFNDFGLVAITRKRVKQSLERTLCTPCPACEGAGYVKSVHTVIGEILQEAQKMAKLIEGDDVLLRVNPEVAKVLKSNKNDYLQEIEEILSRTVMVKSDPSLHQTKFDLA
jgi:ribonuclease G